MLLLLLQPVLLSPLMLSSPSVVSDTSRLLKDAASSWSAVQLLAAGLPPLRLKLLFMPLGAGLSLHPPPPWLLFKLLVPCPGTEDGRGMETSLGPADGRAMLGMGLLSCPNSPCEHDRMTISKAASGGQIAK